MISRSEARTLARRLAEAASSDDPAAWDLGLQTLEGLDGAAWLLVDQAARTFSYADGTPVSGTQGWLRTALNEPSGFVAAVASLHADGRFRERAVQVLSTVPGAVAVPALAVRLLDHVPEVRARAREALPQPRLLACAEPLLDILLAGADRQHAGDALATVKAALVDDEPSRALMMPELLTSGRRRVRRWAFQLGHDQGLLSTDRLVAATLADPDQWLQARCAEWLAEGEWPGVLASLLGARSVEARLVVLARVSDGELGDDALRSMVVDRAPRVREAARLRARHRGWDVAELYRQGLQQNASPRVIAACLDGLALTGDGQDLELAVGGLQHASARVRAAAVVAVSARAMRDHAIQLLASMLLDPSARVSSTAARELARVGAPSATAESAWGSGQPWSRRAGWRLSRAAGGWHRVEADLRAAADPDVALSAVGHFGIRNWLEVGAARTWASLSENHRTRIASLLVEADLSGPARRLVAFHAGIDLPAEEQESPQQAEESPKSSDGRRWGWLRLIRGS
jgi:hypothetical protein